MKRVLIGLTVSSVMMGGVAFAHPHSDTSKDAVKKSWPYFGDSAEASNPESPKENMPKVLSDMEQHFKKHAEKIRRDVKKAREKNTRAFSHLDQNDVLENPDEIRKAARAFEDMLQDSDVFENMADMFLDLSEKMDVDTHENGLSLSFNGNKLGSLHMKREGNLSENLELEGLGKNMSVEREIFIKNGKKRTRIIIEMDEGEDVDIEVQPKKSDD